MKVAILGASGIGKNHAGWFAGHGCEIVAFLGSSPESIPRTTALLREKIGFTGEGFENLDSLIAETQPDIVCVSTPPRLHFEQVRVCLNSGAHVLCEKPLVGDDENIGAQTWQEIVAEGQELVKLAQQKERVFGAQMQYGHAAPILSEMAGLGDEPLLEWSMEFETRTVRTGRTGAQIWVDLSPHPLSVLQKMRGPIEIDWSSARCEIDEMKSEASFTVRLPGQCQTCNARIFVGCNPERDVPLRRVTINGKSIDYVARRNDSGEFKAFFSDGQTVREEADLVDMLIGNFIRACRAEEALCVTGEDGASNVEMQLRLLESAGIR